MTRVKKTKSKVSLSDWIGIGGLIVNIVLIGFTFFALKEARKSTTIAYDALALQQKQTMDAVKKESDQNRQDSIKNGKSVELVERQIYALNQQVKALNRGVRNNEVSQKPQIEVQMLGFVINNLNEPDSVVLSYRLTNYGIRPAILKKSTFWVLDNRFKIVGKHSNEVRTLFVGDKGFAQTIRFTFDLNDLKQDCLICNINDILKIGDLFFCITIDYYDPFLSEEMIIHDDPLFYKWKKRKRSELLQYSSGTSCYYSSDLCSTKSEIDYIAKAINNYKK